MKEVLICQNNIKELSNIEELFSFLNELFRDNNLIYRGCTSIDYKLTPGFYRGVDDKWDTLGVDREEEQRELLSLFIKFVEKENLFDFYFQAQHCGVRTKLLDFSYSPFIALLFAVEDWTLDNSNENDDGVLYVLNCSKFSCIDSSKFDLLSELLLEDEGTIGLQIDGRKADNCEIKFIKPPKDSKYVKRIENQKSCFLYFPKMCQMITSLDDSECEYIIRIDKRLQKEINTALAKMNITMSFMKEI